MFNKVTNQAWEMEAGGVRRFPKKVSFKLSSEGRVCIKEVKWVAGREGGLRGEGRWTEQHVPGLVLCGSGKWTEWLELREKKGK